MPQITGTLVMFGDSITAGSGASGASNRYANIVTTTSGFTLSNQGVGSYQIHEVSNKVYENYLNIQEKNQFSTFIGFNDMRQQGSDATNRGHYKGCLMGTLAWLGLPAVNKKTGKDAAVTYSGTWTDSALHSSPNVTAKESTTLNDTATFTAYGSTVYICMGSWNSGTGVVSVTVDGVSKGSFNLFNSYTSVLGSTAHAFLIRLTGLTDQVHTVVLTVAVSGGKTTFVWGGGNHGINSLNSPDVYVGNVMKMTATGYTTDLTNGSDSAAESYNTDILDVVTKLSSDNLGITYVDVCSNFNPNAGLISGDNVHPNNAGHAVIAEVFLNNIKTRYQRILVT